MKLRDVDTGIGKLRPISTGGDHRFYRVECPAGHVLGQTKTSRKPSNYEIGPDLVSQMAKQIAVPRPFFLDLVGCTKGYPEYLVHHRHEGCRGL